MKQWLLLMLAGTPLLAAGAVAFLPPASLPVPWQAGSSTLQPAPAQATAGQATSGQTNPGQPNPGTGSPVQSATPAAPQSSAPPPNTQVSAASAGSGGLGSVGTAAGGQAGGANVGGTPVFTPATAMVGVSPAQSANVKNLAHITGRRIMPQLHIDASNELLKYVGRITNEHIPDVAIGSGTLIDNNCVLTAGHVLETALAREATFGRPMFILPNGGSGFIVDEVVDGGWRKKVISFDIGVGRVEGDLHLNGNEHAQWEPLGEDDSPPFGQSVHISGYDMDLWAAGNRNSPVQLVDRSALLEPLSKYKQQLPNAFLDAVIKVQDINGGAGWSGFGNPVPDLAMGAAFLGGAYYGLKGAAYDSYGWSSEAVGATGVDGGPVWVGGLLSNPADVRIIGVIGQPSTGSQPLDGITLGRLAGSRITPGACVDMIRDFIK